MCDPAPKRSVFLIGPMGSGKTAVGRALARRLGRPFADSDAEIESRTGVDIAYIFEREGEEGFRIREREVIDTLTATAGIVLASGGAVHNLVYAFHGAHNVLLDAYIASDVGDLVLHVGVVEVGDIEVDDLMPPLVQVAYQVDAEEA